jgi:hypothetical protein
MVFAGWLVSAHLRAVEPGLLQRAGRQTAGVIDVGLDLADRGNLGAAQLISQAAEQKRIPGSAKLTQTIRNVAEQRPQWLVSGGAVSPGLQRVFQGDTSSNSGPEMLTDFMIRAENREKALQYLQSSSLPGVQALLQCRTLTNTTVFPPTSSGAGQAFDASICICGLLLEEEKLAPGLRDALNALSMDAMQHGNFQPLEEVLIDFMSLGQRLNWGQLAALVEHVENTNTLHRLTGEFRDAGQRMPLLFSVVEVSGRPGAVCDYLVSFSQTGLADLNAALPYGRGGLDELLQRGQRLYISGLRQRLAGQAAWTANAGAVLISPRLGFALKCFCYLAGGFLLALAIHFAMPAPPCERPLQVRGFHLAREFLFALGFLFVVLLLSEPFLAQDIQKVNPTFRLRLPALGSVVPARTTGANPAVMNPINILTLLLFFVLQGLLYVASLVKLAEIRRINALPRIKLRLLENEDHLFDAGLYLGFVGTIISLILVSLGVIKPSLMAAYSSTSFGIIFVSIFKIFHLRPARRTLLLQAEAQAEEIAAESTTPVAAAAYVAP